MQRLLLAQFDPSLRLPLFHEPRQKTHHLPDNAMSRTCRHEAQRDLAKLVANHVYAGDKALIGPGDATTVGCLSDESSAVCAAPT